MYRFHVYFENTLIGWTNLEVGDPPMGVAMGKFIASPSYSEIQPLVISATEKNEQYHSLTVRQADGTVLKSSSAIELLDYSPDLGQDGIEISVFGIIFPPYESLFPEHVAAYEHQFPSGV